MIRIGIGEDGKALENLIKAGSIQDGHAEIWSHIANLWNRLGEPEKALAAIRKALELAPESYPYLQQYVNYLEARLDTHQSETIAELRDLGKCIIFSTHIMSEVERLCDRIAIIYRGHILSEGTLPELRQRHDENDLEELFFQLISRHDEQRTAP